MPLKTITTLTTRTPGCQLVLGLVLLVLPLGCGSSGGSGGDGGNGDGLGCAPVGSQTRQIDEAKLYFEFQSTDNDTGIHGFFDGAAWSELCVSSPDGMGFLALKPLGSLGDFGMSGVFFESNEPPADEVPQDDVIAQFPEGDYDVLGTTIDGESLLGTALVTHDIPKPPVIIAPTEGELVDPNDLVVEWEPVTETVKGDPVTIVGYEIIVTNEDKDGDDPNGMSHPIASIHVIPSVSSLTIPTEFLEPSTEYELEVIAIEESGNQTITVVFFDTP